MGQTGLCENLRFPVVFFENLRLRNAVLFQEISKNLRNSAQKKKKCDSAPFVPLSLSLLIPLGYKLLETLLGRPQLRCRKMIAKETVR